MRLGLGLGIVKSAASIYKGILDKFPNAVAAYSTRKLKTSYPTTLPADYGGGAAAAYSLRKVKADYEGSAVKVRRSSDGELQDIGFDSSGNLDTTALTTFVNEQYDHIDEDFSSDLGWTFFNGTSNISGGTLNFNTSTNDYAFYSYGAVPNQVMDIEFTISNYVSGGIFMINFGGGYSSPTYSANQTVTLTDITNGNGNLNWGFRADSSGFVGSIDNFKVTIKTADGHVTRWYSQSDPVDTYTADFSGGVDNFVGNGDNTPTGGLSITDEYGTTIDNVLELNCDNTNDTEHPLRKNNPFGASNPINGKTLKCSFKMLVPSGQTGLVSAALSDGNLTTGGILSDGKVTEQGRWTTFTDVAWTQTALQSRLIFMGLDSSDDPEFVATAGEKFYIADVVLTETTDAYNGEGSQQPLIVEGGDVVLENGKAAIEFTDGSHYLQSGTLSSFGNVYTVAMANNLTDAFYAYGLTTSSQYNSLRNNGSTTFLRGTSDISFSQSLPTGQALWFAVQDTTSSVHVDGVLKVSGSNGSSSVDKITLSARDGGIDGGNVMQEFILFDSNQSSNRKDIEWNINNHYSIYDQWDRESCMNVRRSSDNVTQDIGFSGKNINQTQLESFVNDASPVLDDYTGAAAAYSLRKIRTAYTGSAIEVRRSSNGDTLNIGFNSNGDLDTTTLTTFVGTQNLIFPSEDFGGASYTKQTGITATSNTSETTDPLGGSAAAKIVSTNTNETSGFYINGLSLPTSSDLVRSIYLKGAVGGETVVLKDPSGYGGTTSVTLTTAWQRFTHSTSAGVTDAQGLFVDDISVGTIYAFGAQCNEGTTAATYNPTTTGIGGDGHVTTWYDQAGSNNATADCSNPSACEQPLIVEAGDVVLDNNKPAIKFDGVDDTLLSAASFAQPYTAFAVRKFDSSADQMLISHDTTTFTGVEFRFVATTRISNGTYLNHSVSPTTTQGLLYALGNGSNSQISIDGGTTTTGNSGTAGVNELSIGGRASYYFNGKIQEAIYFDSDQSGNRQSIEGNIGRYYNITGYRDGFVTKWYDQSGEYNHAENSTSDEQPQIVSNGSMLKENGKAALDFDGVDDELTIPSSTSSFNYLHNGSNAALMVVGSVVENDANFGIVVNNGRTTSKTGYVLQIEDRSVVSASRRIKSFATKSVSGQSVFTNQTADNAIDNDTQFLIIDIIDGDNATASDRSELYIDGGSAIKNNTSTNAPTSADATDDMAFFQRIDGKAQEIIIFNSDQSSNRTDIEKNINTHFKIYS